MKISLKKPFLTAGVLLAAICINSPGVYAESKGGDLPLIRSMKEPVASVDGKVITEEELRTAVNNIMPLQSFHVAVSDRRFAAMRKKSLEQLIDNHLIYKYALSKKDAEITDKEFEDRLDSLKKRLNPDDTLEKALKRSNMSMDDLREDLKFEAVVLRTRLNSMKKFKKDAEKLVTEDFMRDYYSKNLEKFKIPAQIHLRGILLKVDPSASQRIWSKARKDIMEISKEVENGADFAELAKKHSQSADASKGGDMGWAHEGSLLPDIEGAVSRLKVGEISGPVMSIYGVHLFKLEGERPAKQRAFKDLNQEKLKSELVEKEYKVLWDNWLKGLRKNAKVEYLKKI
ncbi:MAG: peptidylprolyl isomerase [Thermodesulfobacteriota bacterium]